MSENSLIISDLHLSAQRPDLCQAFVQFCQQQAREVDSLYILGDLCDAWVGDDDDSEVANLVRETLSALSAAGTRVFLMTGNRDFLMGQQLANECGINLLEDPSVATLGGQKVLLMHGDSMCTQDSEYMAFRAKIRNPATQQMLLSKSLEERRGIAQMLRSQSKSANASKAEDIMDVTSSEVIDVLESHQTHILIHGHTHRPAIHELTLSNDQAAKRYVLGDWDKQGWMIKASDNTLELINFDL